MCVISGALGGRGVVEASQIAGGAAVPIGGRVPRPRVPPASFRHRRGRPTRDYLGGRGDREPSKEGLGGSFLYFVNSVSSYYGHPWAF